MKLKTSQLMFEKSVTSGLTIDAFDVLSFPTSKLKEGECFHSNFITREYIHETVKHIFCHFAEKRSGAVCFIST